MEAFAQWRFLLPDDSSLCQIDRKITRSASGSMKIESLMCLFAAHIPFLHVEILLKSAVSPFETRRALTDSAEHSSPTAPLMGSFLLQPRMHSAQNKPWHLECHAWSYPFHCLTVIHPSILRISPAVPLLLPSHLFSSSSSLMRGHNAQDLSESGLFPVGDL